MSSLKELCSGLPVDPLPEVKVRDPLVLHAPVRKFDLTEDERKVYVRTREFHVATRCVGNVASREERFEVFPATMPLNFGARICERIERIWSYLHVPFPTGNRHEVGTHYNIISIIASVGV